MMPAALRPFLLAEWNTMPIRLPSRSILLSLTLSLAACSTAPTTSNDHQPATVLPVTSATIPAGLSHPTNEDAAIRYLADQSRDITKLAPDYIYLQLRNRADKPDIAAAFDQFLLGNTTYARQKLIKTIELDFIHDPNTSALDLLNPELSAHFQEFDWQENDYPGGPEGPDEQLADILTDAFDIVTPERRANRSRTAVIVRNAMTQELWEYILDQWEPVPGEGDWKLNRYAKNAYLQMRDAAAADGVDLTILSGHRDPERARQNAARVGNSFAVASFSSHSLGLAIDFVLPRADAEEPFRLTTRPMKEVVDMRRSPVHKWLHLYGYRHGWYPFQHEPWHWEYNPPGFRDVFFADFPGGPPAINP
ncbi:D-alanyl-D-alanine carboxypeptidase family protein [Mucisphaera sp.]|uniref:D-alanyl-D-alanine carboxypeptidase family protein n=1 Tax=Mucisphaera sp. TaxID=2913024 RepID=UPI003D11FB3D